MGLSAASMSPVRGISSYRAAVQQAYTIDNESDFSSAFVDSVKGLGSADAVMGATPVQYPTATIMTRRIGQIEDNQRVNEGLNSIASGYEGVTTGYGRSSDAVTGYGMVGSSVDLYA